MKKLIGIGTAIFALAFLASLLFFLTFFGIFHDFYLISDTVWIYGSCIAAAAIAIVSLVIAVVLMKSEKKTKLGNWLSTNTAKLLLVYLLLDIFFVSIKSEIIWSFSDIKEVISLEWTIFGISGAIFLIWNVVAIEYLSQKKPKKPETIFPTKIWQYIQEKGNFYSSASMLLSNINLLFVNLVCLIVATVFVHVLSCEVTMLNQTLVILVLFLCTNTILGLFLDIVKPFYEKKEELLRETKVTNADIDLQNEIDKQAEKTLTAIKAIEALPNIDQEEKTKVMLGILQNFSDMFGEKVENVKK